MRFGTIIKFKWLKQSFSVFFVFLFVGGFLFGFFFNFCYDTNCLKYSRPDKRHCSTADCG